MLQKARPSLRQFLIALGAVAAALVLLLPINYFAPRTVVWPLFLAALMFSAWRGGLGAKLPPIRIFEKPYKQKRLANFVVAAF